MKKFIFALTVCCLSLQATAQTQPDAQKAAGPETAENARREVWKVVPDEVFNRELKDLDGRSLFLSNYRGRVFVINLWATWCGPCRSEIPHLVELKKKYAGRGVEFVGLTTEDPVEDAERVRDFVSQMKMDYKIGWIDGDTAMALIKPRPVIPQTFVVAADGRIIAHLTGYSPEAPAFIRDGIEKALNPAPEQQPRTPDSPPPARP